MKTTNIILATTLKLYGYELEDIEIDGNRGTFVFKGVDDTIITNFNLAKCLVEPLQFNSVLRQLTTSVKRMTK